MKWVVISCFLSISFASIAQVQFSWSALWKLETTNTICAIDQYNNLYYTNNQTLFKVDSSGVQKFSQSVKSWSTIKAIDARNPMKILLFSEDQQTLNYLDNTLTKQHESIDLTEEGFSFVTKAITSAQADKIWLFDSDNSRLVLYTNHVSQRQQVDNVYGLLQIRTITQLVEHNTQLYLVDPTKGVFVLDRYGTLVSFFDLKNTSHIQIENDILYYLKENELYFLDLKDKYSEKINLPISGIKQFYKNGSRFYLITESTIEVFAFQ